MSNKLPILFVFFNRPNETLQALSRIKAYEPEIIYLSSDGGRNLTEKKLVAELRELVLKNITWECDIKCKFETQNIGCKNNVGSSVKWFFGNVDKGVVLEDDILVSVYFFQFMEHMLSRFEQDKSVQMVSGFNFSASDLFSSDLARIRFPNVWSWGSWSDRFADYEYDLTYQDILYVHDNFDTKNKKVKLYVNRIFDKIYNNTLNTWDYQILLLMLKHNRHTIIPRYPLMKNVGFGPDATHTVQKVQQDHVYDSWYPKISDDICLDEVINKHIENKFYDGQSIIEKFFTKIRMKMLK